MLLLHRSSGRGRGRGRGDCYCYTDPQGGGRERVVRGDKGRERLGQIHKFADFTYVVVEGRLVIAVLALFIGFPLALRPLMEGGRETRVGI